MVIKQSKTVVVLPLKSLLFVGKTLLVVLTVLLSGCSKPTVPAPKPVAAFVYAPGSNGVVQFTNASQNTAAYQWSFGDGGTSAEASPAHTYAQNGSYTTTLIARRADGVQDQIQKVVSVQSIPKPVADFSFKTGAAGAVQFTNLCRNASLYQWKFADGQAVTDANPTITYSTNGSYNVTLTAKNGIGEQDVISKRVDVSNLPVMGNLVVSSAVKTRGNLDVFLDGTFYGTLKSYNEDNTVPTCGDPAWVTITKPAGTYLLTAKGSAPTAAYWQYNVTIINGKCTAQKITMITGDAIFWTNFNSPCAYDVYVDGVYQGTGKTYQPGSTPPVVYTRDFVTVNRPAGTYRYEVRQTGACATKWSGTFTVKANEWSSVFLPN